MSALLTAGLVAGGSVIGDLISQWISNDNKSDALDMFRKKMGELLISDEEKSQLLNQARRTTNTNVANANNLFGIQGANKANKSTFSAAMLGPVLAKQNESLFNLDQNIFNQNQNIKSNIAQSYLSEPTGINLGQTIAAGIGGFQTGLSIDNYINADQKFLDQMKAMKDIYSNGNGISLNNMSSSIQGLDSLYGKF